MKHYLTVLQKEGQRAVDSAIAALLVEAKDGDEIIVENAILHRLVTGVLDHGACPDITVTVDKAAVDTERMKANANTVIGRLTGAERNDPRRPLVRDAVYYGTPVGSPGSRTLVNDGVKQPPPDIIHHPTPPPEEVQE